jgi:hypothetical protein
MSHATAGASKPEEYPSRSLTTPPLGREVSRSWDSSADTDD